MKSGCRGNVQQGKAFLLSVRAGMCLDDDEYPQAEWAGMNEPRLIDDIVAANEKGDVDAFKRSVEYFNRFLRSNGLLSSAFIESPVVDILTARVRGECEIDNQGWRLSLLCLYYMTLFEDMSVFLVSHGVLDAFLHVLRGPVRMISGSVLDGIRNLCMDLPWLPQELHDRVGIRFFLSAVEQGIDHLQRGTKLTDDQKRRYALAQLGLLQCFSTAKIPGEEVELLVEFYRELLSIDCPVPWLCEGALGGLISLAHNGKIKLVDASIFNDFPDVIELASSSESPSMIVAACDFVSELLKCNVKTDFSITQVLEICRQFFDEDCGTAAYRLVYAVTKNGDGDESMSICLNGLPVLVRGIWSGAFETRRAATETMFRVIDNTDHLLVSCFLDTDGWMHTMLSLLDYEEYAPRALEKLNIVFERCVVDEKIGDFLGRFFEADGREVIERLLAEQRDEKSLAYANRLMERIKGFV